MNYPALSTFKGDILIVDDKPDNLSLLSSMLESQGYTVRKAINGKIALTGALLSKPDLILLDINMPDINGYELCKQIKSNEEIKDIPIIFLTVLEDSFYKIKGFELGCVDYITKPFNPKEVLARIENQLSLYQLKKELKHKNKILESEILERKIAEEKIKFILNTIQSISQASDFQSALNITIKSCCRLIGWDLGEALIPNEDGTVLEYSYVWGNSESEIELKDDIELFLFAHTLALPKKIWLSKQIEWIEDIEEFSKTITENLPSSLKLKSAFGVPIIEGSQTLAVLVFFKKERVAKDFELIDMVNSIAIQLAGIIQRKKMETDLQQANLELKRLTVIDNTTQIANRFKFHQYLEEQWQRLKRAQLPLSIIMCDVDYFKLYNDTYGHQAGDSCLRNIACAIADNLKRPEDLVARYGGEEFIVILPNTSTKGALQVAESIKFAVENLKIAHINSQVSNVVTVSVGVATMIPFEDTSSGLLISNADKALYKAKSQGRNRVIIF